jgi:hypothetical protein
MKTVTKDGIHFPAQHARPRAVRRRLSLPQRVLQSTAALWFLIALLGQFLFMVYVTSFYGGAALQGNFTSWNKIMPHGYVAGQTLGNAAIAGHLLLAAIITLGGPLQLSAQVRRRAPVFHRWNGRLYLFTAVGASLTGMYMVWFRGDSDNFLHHIGTSLNAVLIIACGVMTVSCAMAHDVAAHRRWALRLFLAVSGVWFYRVGLMFWIFVNNGPVGFDPVSFRGPVLTTLSFVQYALPLLMLECYWQAKERGGPISQTIVAGSLLILTAAMGAGIAAAAKVFWLPLIQASF